MEAEGTAGEAQPDAAGFDQWYADMGASPVRDTIVARALGLPPGLLSSSLLTWDGIAEVTDALRLPEGGLLVDAGCGRGGYGIEIARRSGARLLGVDISEVALAQAKLAGERLLPAGRAEFRSGTLTATGLPAATAAGLMCVDAVQFANPPLTALREFRRVLAAAGRLVLTCWEAADPADDRIPARIRRVNLLRDLPAAGFTEVQLHEKPDWLAAERRYWQEMLAAPADAGPAVRSLQEEGRQSLASHGSLRRVLATATAA